MTQALAHPSPWISVVIAVIGLVLILPKSIADWRRLLRRHRGSIWLNRHTWVLFALLLLGFSSITATILAVHVRSLALGLAGFFGYVVFLAIDQIRFEVLRRDSEAMRPGVRRLLNTWNLFGALVLLTFLLMALDGQDDLDSTMQDTEIIQLIGKTVEALNRQREEIAQIKSAVFPSGGDEDDGKGLGDEN